MFAQNEYAGLRRPIRESLFHRLIFHHHTVLMNTGLMSKGIRAYNRLVWLHLNSLWLKEAAGRRKLLGNDVCFVIENVATSPKIMTNLPMSNSRPLADPVYRTLHLLRTGLMAAMELATASPRSLWQ
jgi:hypothetical protein